MKLSLAFQDQWKYGEQQCLLCNRPAYPTTYYPLNFVKTNKTKTIPLCQFHKGVYMAHGIKRLDEMLKNEKV